MEPIKGKFTVGIWSDGEGRMSLENAETGRRVVDISITPHELAYAITNHGNRACTFTLYGMVPRQKEIPQTELDKILERSAAQLVPEQSAPPPQQQPMQPNYGHPGHGYNKPYHERRKSFLEELFD